jgi:citrate lyase subunit beta/citryl-CoA lyase
VRWRSLLFVPANRPDLAAKALRNSPDLVVLDLEDAVPPEAKQQARVTAAQVAEELRERVALCIRVNAPSSPWFRDDVDSLPAGIAAVVIPKWEAPIEVGFPVIAGLETVRGVADARNAFGTTEIACYFGAEDYIADLGGVRTSENLEVLHARSTVAVAARLAGIPALDMVTLDFGDDDRFTTEAAGARAMGFAGKLCIHPRQVTLANQAFVPSAEEVARASRLLAAYAAAGGGVVAFEGQMVDEVVAVLARRVLAQTLS